MKQHYYLFCGLMFMSFSQYALQQQLLRSEIERKQRREAAALAAQYALQQTKAAKSSEETQDIWQAFMTGARLVSEEEIELRRLPSVIGTWCESILQVMQQVQLVVSSHAPAPSLAPEECSFATRRIPKKEKID